MRSLSILLAAGGVVLLAALLVNGCASHPSPVDPAFETLESLLEAVRANVSDPARAERIEALLPRLKSEYERFGRDLLATRKQLFELNRDYDAKRADFEAIWKRFREVRTAFARTMFDLRRQVAALTTTEEWSAAYAAVLPAGSKGGR